MSLVRTGERLADRYEILAEIGRGGMGAVFEAEDEVLARRVAIKVVSGASTAGSRSHLQHEARLAAKLDHPAIVPVYDFGADGERIFFVMPIVEGLTLRQMLADGPLPQVVAAVVVRQIAEALAHSHAKNVVHRDIKPENVMVAAGSDGPRVKVLDFGIAVSAADARAGTPRQIVGTPDYLSPEQASGGPVDARSDVYSVGAVLYECCTGAPPFVAADVFGLVEQIIHLPAPRTRAKAPGIDFEIDDLVASCLEKDPGRRPESADRVVEILTSVGARLRPMPLAPPGPRRPAGRPAAVHSTLPAAPKIVGRQAELLRVRSRLVSAARGECQLVAVGGAFGVGKSAFAAAVCETAAEQSMTVLRGRFVVDDDEIAPYQAISDAFAGFFRTTIDGEEWFREPRLLARLVGLFPHLRGIVRLPEASEPPPPRANRAETFELISCALAELLARGPVLLVLEDIHSARTSIDAVRYLIRRLAAAPLAVVLTHRTGDADPEHPLFELRSALLGEPAFLDLELWPLPRADSDALATSLLPGATVDPALAEHLHRVTEGNPLHLTELTTALREAGQIRVDGEVWRLDAGAGDLQVVPTSMRHVVERRLARLSSSERGVLEGGALFGRSFTYEDIAAFGVPMIDAALDRLIRGGIVSREATGSRDRYVFSSVIVAETARDALGPGKRRELHRRFADHLVAYGRTEGAEATRVAHHLVLAGERGQALTYAVRAAAHALDASVPEDVFKVQALVGEPAGPLTKEEIDLLLLVARAHALAKDGAKAKAVCAHALDLLERSRPHQRRDLETAEVTALRLSAELAWSDRDRDTALELARKARAMASALGRDADVEAIEPLVRAIERPALGDRDPAADGAPASQRLSQGPSAQEMLGERLLVQGEYLAARELLARVDARRSTTESPEEAARHALKSALLAHRLGSYDEAELVARSARQRVSADPLAAEIDAAVSLVHSSRGRFEQAWSLAQSALDRLGVSPPEQHARALLLRAKGDASMGLGRFADATDLYDRSHRLLDPMTEPLEHSTSLFGSGDARITAGKPDEAERFFERAERLKLAIGDRWGLSRVHDGFARVCLDKGRLADATSHAQRAVALAVAIADPKLTAATRARLAMTQLACGEVKDAASAAALALRDAEGCGADPEIAAALAATAAVQLASGEAVRAAESAKEALARSLRLGMPVVQVAALTALAAAQRESGGREGAAAKDRVADAAAQAERIGSPYLKLEVAIVRAAVLEDSAAFGSLVDRAAALGAGRHVGEALLAHAALWVARGDRGRATPLFMQASAVFAEMGAHARAEAALARVE